MAIFSYTDGVTQVKLELPLSSVSAQRRDRATRHLAMNGNAQTVYMGTDKTRQCRSIPVLPVLADQFDQFIDAVGVGASFQFDQRGSLTVADNPTAASFKINSYRRAPNLSTGYEGISFTLELV